MQHDDCGVVPTQTIVNIRVVPVPTAATCSNCDSCACARLIVFCGTLSLLLQTVFAIILYDACLQDGFLAVDNFHVKASR